MVSSVVPPAFLSPPGRSTKTQLLFHRGVQLQHYDEVQHVGPHEEVVGVVGLIALLIVPSRFVLLASCGGRTMLPSRRGRGNRR